MSVDNGSDVELEDDGFVPATNPTKEDYDAVVARNRKLFARAKKAEARSRGTGEQPEPKPAEKPVEPKPAGDGGDVQKPAASDEATWRERIELKTEGYSEDEITFLQQNGGRKALENDYVKNTIKLMRDQKAAEAATVETDGGKSEVEKKYTDEQLRAMSTDELAKILPHAQ